MALDPELMSVAADSFRLLADTRHRLNRITQTAKEAVQKHYKTPESMKAFIEENGTTVYCLGGHFLARVQATFTLRVLGFSTGFIPKPDSEQGQKRYRKLVAWLTRHEERSPIYFDEARFEQGVFVLSPEEFNVPCLTVQIHHWMAYRAGFQGYSETAQALYRKFWDEYNGEITPNLLNALDTSELVELKQIINRDMEALQFLRLMVDEVFAPANQAKKQLG